MTYYIYEMPDGRQIGEYVDDGKSEVTLVTERASVLTRKIVEPPTLYLVEKML